MSQVVVRFEDVSFEYDKQTPVFKQVNFSVRKGAKFALMGQNGAGKSTLFKLLMQELWPDAGEIHLPEEARVATALQRMPEEYKELTVQGFLKTMIGYHVYDLDRQAKDVLQAVNLNVPLERNVGFLSGGEQARLLLAGALIQKPDILLLDEPTNNLDVDGIAHLTDFLNNYENTVIVVSHDKEFLNNFTDGIIYIDVHRKDVRQYAGDYNDVEANLQTQIERENRANVQTYKQLQEYKKKAGDFQNKHSESAEQLAAKFRKKAAALEEEFVEVTKDDKVLAPFLIPAQETINTILRISKLSIIRNNFPVTVNIAADVRRGEILRIAGPNGIGKTTLLNALVSRAWEGAQLAEDVKVGYYHQDFSGMDMDMMVYDALEEVNTTVNEEHITATAARFLLHRDLLTNTVGSLSEGQKGLLSFARFTLMQPGLLIVDEPTNHINFRHIPAILHALNEFEGGIIVVSHNTDFVKQLDIDHTIDLERT